MERIIHPISGEYGYFCSHHEKIVIDESLKLLASHIDVGDDALD